MGDRLGFGRTGACRSYLRFPDGTLTVVSEKEVVIYLGSRIAHFDDNGLETPRPAVSDIATGKNGEPALFYSTGGADRVHVHEISEFFPNSWTMSSFGFMTAKIPLPPPGMGGDIPRNRLPAQGRAFLTGCSSLSVGEVPLNSNWVLGLERVGSLNDAAVREDGVGNEQVLDAGNMHQQDLLGVGPLPILEEIFGEKLIGMSSSGQMMGDMGGKTDCSSPPKAKGWAGLYGNNRNANCGFVVPEIHDGVTDEGVFLTEDLIEPDEMQGKRLIGYFAPRYPGPEAVAKFVQSWDVPQCKFFQHMSKWTVFTFENSEDMGKVLENGPYFLSGLPLYVKKLPALFDFGWENLSSLPVWVVQLPNIPLECWNTDCLGRICTFFGVPQHADAATRAKERLSFARVLVEVDVSKTLPKFVHVHLPGKVIMQAVLFEDLPVFCTRCMKLGHGHDACSSPNPMEPTLYISRAARKRAGFYGPGKGNTQVDKDGWKLYGGRKRKAGRQDNFNRWKHITDEDLLVRNREKEKQVLIAVEDRILGDQSRLGLDKNMGSVELDVPPANLGSNVVGSGGNRSAVAYCRVNGLDPGVPNKDDGGLGVVENEGDSLDAAMNDVIEAIGEIEAEFGINQEVDEEVASSDVGTSSRGVGEVRITRSTYAKKKARKERRNQRLALGDIASR